MTTVADLLEVSNLSLSLVAGEEGLGRQLRTSELNRPALELTGYFDDFKSERVQIFGLGEVAYMERRQGEKELQANLTRLLAEPVPCVIVSNGCAPPKCLRDHAEAACVPLLTCPYSTTRLYKRLWEHLDEEFAPETSVHGVLLDIHDTGVLLLGESAVGKSECGLELIRRGFRLVADDMVQVKRVGESQLVGRAAEMFPYHMEARGLGIIDISQLYGVAAIRQKKHITLAISLMEWDPATDFDRTGLDKEYMTILDVEIPLVTIPLRPGRNVGTLVEAATLNQILRDLGTDTAEQVQQKLAQQLGMDDSDE